MMRFFTAPILVLGLVSYVFAAEPFIFQADVNDLAFTTNEAPGNTHGNKTRWARAINDRTPSLGVGYRRHSFQWYADDTDIDKGWVMNNCVDGAGIERGRFGEDFQANKGKYWKSNDWHDDDNLAGFGGVITIEARDACKTMTKFLNCVAGVGFKSGSEEAQYYFPRLTGGNYDCDGGQSDDPVEEQPVVIFGPGG